MTKNYVIKYWNGWYINGISLPCNWIDVDTNSIEHMFNEYKTLPNRRDTYFENVLLPPFVDVFYELIERNLRIPTPVEFYNAWLELNCTVIEDGFALKPHADTNKGEHFNTVLPRKPEQFSFGELKSRIARVYPALYRECYLMYHLQGSKNTNDDKFNGVDMVVNYKRLAIFDDTRRSVTKREIKKITGGKVDLEVHSNFTNNCEQLSCGLYVYTDEFIEWVRDVCYDK